MGGRSCYEHRLGSGGQSPGKALAAFCQLSGDQISPGEMQGSVYVLASEPGAVPGQFDELSPDSFFYFFFKFSVYSSQIKLYVSLWNVSAGLTVLNKSCFSAQHLGGLHGHHEVWL